MEGSQGQNPPAGPSAALLCRQHWGRRRGPPPLPLDRANGFALSAPRAETVPDRNVPVEAMRRQQRAAVGTPLVVRHLQPGALAQYRPEVGHCALVCHALATASHRTQLQPELRSKQLLNWTLCALYSVWVACPAALRTDAPGPVRAWGLRCILCCALSSLRQAWQRGCLWPELHTPKNVAGSSPSQAAQHLSAVPNIFATACALCSHQLPLISAQVDAMVDAIAVSIQ